MRIGWFLFFVSISLNLIALNIIFLDIDGVLNYVTCTDRVPHSSAIFGINQYNVALLSQIVKKTNAKIVLTSSWKSGWELDHFKDVDTIYLAISLALQDLYIMDKTVDEVSPSLREKGLSTGYIIIITKIL